MISWRFTSLHIVCDGDKLEAWRFTCCVMMISLEVLKFTNLHTVCDDNKFGSLEVWRFPQSV